ncbi:MAG: VOC family protein [Sphaerochaeta sp.]|jgi:lactoylglutathione lyase|nr:VOC family protein [Sphaerochaeta sp.]
MKFLWTTIDVIDLDESVRFYEEIVGLSVSRRVTGGPSNIAFMGDGETKVELITHAGATPKGVGAGISIGFAVDDLDEKIAFLTEKGIAIAEGPFSPNPSVRFCYVHDPNGVRVQFVEQH